MYTSADSSNTVPCSPRSAIGYSAPASMPTRIMPSPKKAKRNGALTFGLASPDQSNVRTASRPIIITIRTPSSGSSVKMA